MAALFLAVLSLPTHAVVITFSEPVWGGSGTPIDGASGLGVTFDFKVGGIDSTTARIAAGPGTTTFLDAPLIEGPARNSALTMDFAGPISSLSFGVAVLGSPTPFNVELFDPSLSSLGVTNVPLASLGFAPEAQFTYNGSGVSRAVVTFNPGPIRFALDNVEFERERRGVPDGGSTALLAGIALIGLLKAKRSLGS